MVLEKEVTGLERITVYSHEDIMEKLHEAELSLKDPTAKTYSLDEIREMFAHRLNRV